MFRNSALGASFLKLLPCLTGGTPAPVCPSGVIPGPNLVAMKSSTCSNGGMPGQVMAPEAAPVPAAGHSLLMQLCHAEHSMAQQRLLPGCRPTRSAWQGSAGQSGQSRLAGQAWAIHVAKSHVQRCLSCMQQTTVCSLGGAFLLGQAVSSCSSSLHPWQGTAQQHLQPSCAQAGQAAMCRGNPDAVAPHSKAGRACHLCQGWQDGRWPR